MNISTVKTGVRRSDKEWELAALEIQYAGLDGQFCCGRKEWRVSRERLVTLARIMDITRSLMSANKNAGEFAEVVR